jgi:hypothetical protein
MADAKRSSSSNRGKKKKVKTTKAVVKEVVSENVDLESSSDQIDFNASAAKYEKSSC